MTAAKKQTSNSVATETVYDRSFQVVRRQTAISVLLGTIIKCSDCTKGDMAEIINKNIVRKFQDSKQEYVFGIVKDIIQTINKLGMFQDNQNVLKITMSIKNTYDGIILDDKDIRKKWELEIFNLLFQGKINQQITKLEKDFKSDIDHFMNLLDQIKKYVAEDENLTKPKTSKPCGDNEKKEREGYLTGEEDSDY